MNQKLNSFLTTNTVCTAKINEIFGLITPFCSAKLIKSLMMNFDFNTITKSKSQQQAKNVMSFIAITQTEFIHSS